ncbi:methyltransferase [Nocardiopsis sp. TSRI0078]|uniref:class I SAM-dependent methyltransferase n=1 Tax=unclassified Nocardiopsis TaxID=2649073 RepID=UPI00093ACDF0|nr:class I SAM-dependent methyltransferase [Nocardiopsis sp. TSRI0078]OKI22950.1 methyltransferase [Nocardiopsis sp. TSRI0078]
MPSFDDPAFFGEHWSEHYDDRPNPDPAPAVDFLHALAAGGRVLELASGTGRVALPLAARGVDVEGVEGSAAMVERMRALPGGADLPVVVGDMADVPVEGPYDLVFLVFNTLFNLPDQKRQTDCFANVARVLEPGGRFVLECFVPGRRELERDSWVEVSHLTEDSVTLHVYKNDPVAQRYAKQILTFTPQDGMRSMLPVALRYCWPAELDLMARMAGLELEERHADWHGRPFDASSPGHVSVYRLPGRG